MISVRVIVVVAVAVAVLSTAFAVASQSFIDFFATALDDKLGKNTVGGHTAGYGLYETSGDVLDPANSYTTASEKVVIDPDKYLRSFNYGHVFKLADGSTVREFTLVADDRQTMEISPGVFYNVWAFNGTVPGPTLRATEGDLIRINFINNGTKPHSIHTHGIHKAEMVMIMNGFDTDFDTENNFYAVNTIPFYYMHHPIEIQKDKLVRVYLVNMLEFDQINNFHLHGNLYQLYRSGTSMAPSEYTDMVTMSQGERAILEFNYKYPGQYMFHAHKTEFAEKGWVGLFLVKDLAETQLDGGSSSRFLETKTISGDVGT